jgi:methionyl-tRNA formyltransferase
MEAGLDTGPVLLEAVTPIDDQTTGASLHDLLAESGARLIVDALARLDQLTPRPQPEAGVTYAHKIAKTEAALDFSRPATELARRIRAFDPFPGCSAVLDDDSAAAEGPSIKFWSATPLSAQGTPGEILQADAGGVVIACGVGALRVSELQRPGSKRLPAREFLAGLPLRAGQRFRTSAPA